MKKAASREDEPPAPEGTQAETWKLPSWDVMEGNQVPGPSSPETLRAARPSQAYRHPQAHRAQRTHTLGSRADPQGRPPPSHTHARTHARITPLATTFLPLLPVGGS